MSLPALSTYIHNIAPCAGFYTDADHTWMPIGDSFSSQNVARAQPFGACLRWPSGGDNLSALFVPSGANGCFAIGGNGSGWSGWSIGELSSPDTGVMLSDVDGGATIYRAMPLGRTWQRHEFDGAFSSGPRALGRIGDQYVSLSGTFPLDGSFNATFPGLDGDIETTSVAWVEDAIRQDPTATGIVMRAKDNNVVVGSFLSSPGPSTALKDITGEPKAVAIESGTSDYSTSGDLACGFSPEYVNSELSASDAQLLWLGNWYWKDDGAGSIAPGRRLFTVATGSMQLNDFTEDLQATAARPKRVLWADIESILDTAPPGMHSGTLYATLCIATEARTRANYASTLGTLADKIDALKSLGYSQTRLLVIVPPAHSIGGGAIQAEFFDNFFNGAKDAIADGRMDRMSVVSLYHLTEGAVFDGSDASHQAWIDKQAFGVDWTNWTYKTGTTVDLSASQGNLRDGAVATGEFIHPANEAAAAFEAELVRLAIENAATNGPSLNRIGVTPSVSGGQSTPSNHGTLTTAGEGSFTV